MQNINPLVCLPLMFRLAPSYAAGTLPPSFVLPFRAGLTKSHQTSRRFPPVHSEVQYATKTWVTSMSTSTIEQVAAQSMTVCSVQGPSRKRPRTNQLCSRPEVGWNPRQFVSSAPHSGLRPANNQRRPGRASKSVETDWACSSSIGTSKASFHDEFSDLFAAPDTGEVGRLGFHVQTRFRIEPGIPGSERTQKAQAREV